VTTTTPTTPILTTTTPEVPPATNTPVTPAPDAAGSEDRSQQTRDTGGTPVGRDDLKEVKRRAARAGY
jgi:hypothetical protein